MKQLQDQDLKNINLNNAVIIDIRSPQEFAREHIENSINIPLDTLNDARLAKFQNKTILFHCQGGTRTLQIPNHIQIKDNMLCLSGGIQQWKRCGLKTLENKKAPLPMMRQVQIAAGILILLGVLLSFLSPYFILITVFVGCGLIFAGLTGFCGMAKLLMLLPYNRS